MASTKDSIQSLQKEVQHLKAENQCLRALVIELGGDPDAHRKNEE